MLFFLVVAAAAPLSLELAGGEAWRMPSKIQHVADGGDVLWVASDSYVRGFDASGKVVADLRPCDDGLYPGGSIRLSADGGRLAVDCGEAVLISLPDGRELLRTDRNTGGQAMVPLDDGGLVTFGPVLQDNDMVRLGHFVLRVHDPSGKRVVDRTVTGLYGLALAPGGLVGLYEGREPWTLKGLTPHGDQARWTTQVPAATNLVVHGDRVCTIHRDGARCFDSRTGASVGTLTTKEEPWPVSLTASGLVTKREGQWVLWPLDGEVQPLGDLGAVGLCGWGDGFVECGHGAAVVRYDRSGVAVSGPPWGRVATLVASRDAERIALLDGEGQIFMGPITDVAPIGKGWTDLAGVGAAGQLVGEREGSKGSVLRTADGSLVPLVLEGAPVDVVHVSFADGVGTAYGYDGQRWAWMHVDGAGAVRSLAPRQLLSSVPLRRFARVGTSLLASDGDSAVLVDPATAAQTATLLGLEGECRPYLREGAIVECEYVEEEGMRMVGGPVYDADVDPSPSGRHALLRPYRRLPSELRDAAGKVLLTLPDELRPSTILWTDGGRHLVVAFHDGRIGRLELP